MTLPPDFTRLDSKLLFLLFLLYLLGPSTATAEVLRTIEDGEVHLNIGTGELSVDQVDGQFFPAVSMIPSPARETQVILEFDLSLNSGQAITDAVLRFYVAGTNSAFSSVRLETWFFDGNGVVDTGDFNAGSEFVGLFSWDAPTSAFPSPAVNEFVQFDVTKVVNGRIGDYVGFNLRLAGDFPDYGGNVFDPDNPFRFLGIAADESGATLRPTLTITSVPEPSAAILIATAIVAMNMRRKIRREVGIKK